jgi:predicted RNase H-like HicB family nuclease
MNLTVDIEQEEDGRWIAEVPQLPGVMVYGISREDAATKVKALALRVLAERLDNGESVPEMSAVFSEAA